MTHANTPNGGGALAVEAVGYFSTALLFAGSRR